MATVDELLDRLRGVSGRGPGKWMARCPSHEDKSPSLSIRVIDDDTILLHDFGGCTALEICASIGFQFRDLFPARNIRRIDSRELPRLSATDALVVIDHEAGVVAAIGADVLTHREIDEETWRRLGVAVELIADARAVCCPAKAPPRG